MDEPVKKLKVNIVQSIVFLFTLLAIVGTIFCNSVFAQPPTEGQVAPQTMSAEKASVMQYGLIAASIAFGLGAVGAGMAISHVGAAAIGAIAEKPQVAGQALIFVALAEGLVVFGFITALMILGKV